MADFQRLYFLMVDKRSISIDAKEQLESKTVVFHGQGQVSPGGMRDFKLSKVGHWPRDAEAQRRARVIHARLVFLHQN